MRKKQQGFKIDNWEIYSGDSEEAQELFRDFGLIQEPEKDVAKDELLMNKSTLFLLALTLTWLSYLFFNDALRQYLNVYSIWLSIIVIMQGASR